MHYFYIKRFLIFFIYNIIAVLAFSNNTYGIPQTNVIWNSLSANSVNVVCGSSTTLTINFSIDNAENLDIEVDLPTGVKYVSGSALLVSGGTLVNVDETNKNVPIFNINANANTSVVLSLHRIANCDARTAQINGGTFEDVVRILKNNTQIGTTNTSNTYQINYAALSITNVTTSPTTTSVGGTVTRAVTISNGSFGGVTSFFYEDSRNSNIALIQNIRVVEGGNNYTFAANKITNSSNTLSIEVDGTMLQNIGNNDSNLDFNEVITIVYDMKITDCYQGGGTASTLNVAWGCEGSTCQSTSTNAVVNLSNGVPNLTFTSISQPALDFCQPVTFSTRLKNNATNPEDFARDVAVIFGMRHNQTPIATPTSLTMWSPLRFSSRVFSNFTINGVAITLPTLNNFGPVDYIPYDYFTTDPDGAGGLEDLDGDGFYDDLQPGAELVLTFDVSVTPRTPSCGNNFSDFVSREHISVDASWFNQCGVQMTPIRDELLWSAFTRNYNQTTLTTATPNIQDNSPFTVAIKPHIGIPNVNCNGGSGMTNDVEFRVALVLPSGVSLSPTASPDNHYTSNSPTIVQSNDTVYYTINRYAYNWFTFELVLDCATRNSNSEYANFEFITRYTCKNGSSICFQDEIHCTSVEALPQCADNCVGATTQSFTSERINPGWTDRFQTALSTNHNKAYAEPFDTVRFTAVSIIRDTTIDNLIFTTIYTGHTLGNLFSFQKGNITIYDIDGQFGATSYTFPITTAPAVNMISGSYQVSFDLSGFQSQISTAYQFGKGSGAPNVYERDSIKLELDFIVDENVPTTTLNTVEDFQGYFSFQNNGQEAICNKYASILNYGRSTLYFYTHNFNLSDCGGQIEKYWRFTSQISGMYPNEYRPYFTFDSLILDLPTGMHFDKVNRLGGGNSSPYITSFLVLGDDTHIIVPRPSNFTDVHTDGQAFPRFDFDVLVDCRLLEGNSVITSSIYAKEYAYLSDVNSQLPVTQNANINVEYTKPAFTINQGQQQKAISDNYVEWDIEVCNTTAGVDIGYNWLIVDDLGGQVVFTGAEDITGATIALTTINNGSGQTIVQFGDLPSNSCKKILLKATYTHCTPDTISVQHGWSCYDYPMINDLFACGTSYLFEVIRESAQLSISITGLASTPSNPANGNSPAFGQSTIDMCTPFPVEITMSASQLGYLFDVGAIMNNPIGGGTTGLEFVSGSGYIEYPVGTMPRAFSLSANTALVGASTATTMPFNLSQIDPTHFNMLPLKGVGTPDSNVVVLRFQLRPNCDLNSGAVLSFQSVARASCGNAAIGSGELISPYNLNITGVTSPYSVNFTNINLPDFYGCFQNASLDIAMTKLGAVSVAASDKLVIILPPDVSYNSLINCSSAICIDPNQLTINTVGNRQVLNFKMPAMNSGDDLAFSLSVTYSTTSHGCSQNTEQVSAQVITSTTLFCASTGSNCPNSGIAVGSINSTADFFKPDIIVNTSEIIDSSFGASPQLYHYEIELGNTSNQNSFAPIVIDFYCSDNQGMPTGSVLHSITTNSILNAGQTVTLSGNFNNNCSAANGVIIQVTQQTANNTQQCICDNEIVQTLRNPVNSISGEVFLDLNLNGNNDIENIGTFGNGIVIHLQDNLGNPILNANNQPVFYTLNNNGQFRFDDLLQNTYKVVLDQTTTPNNYEGGTPNFRTLLLGQGQNMTQQDLAVQACQLSITNVETSLPNCTYKQGGSITITANSNSTNQYSIMNTPNYQFNAIFPNLGIGQYTIRVKNAAGCIANYPSVIMFDMATCVEICNDAIDNDGDGKTDCDDPDCEGVSSANSINHN